MITDRQTNTIARLNSLYPHWRLWYRWEETPFRIREMLMVEVLFMHKQPIKVFQALFLCAPTTIKRNIDSFYLKLDEKEISDNYNKFVATRIDIVPIPANLYKQFIEWHTAFENGIVPLLEKKITRELLK